ncbi:hypothetical protein MP638_000930 [Amoeboaphelidium occidentale]|nr:hypothetical protein MP638_000930 [Amoeboaphelidium occidentale]
MKLVVIIMGVSGCGKSTLLKEFQKRGYFGIEGDEYHPKANIEKMTSGLALTDDDRWPWLQRIVEVVKPSSSEKCAISCSCLKKAYRDFFRERLSDCDLRFVFLSVSKSDLVSRMQSRNHFMPLSLLDSQLSTMEEPSEESEHDVVTVDANNLGPTELFGIVFAKLNRAQGI